MRAEIIAHIEQAAIDTFRHGLVHCDSLEGKLIFARKIETEARKTVCAILDDNPKWSKKQC